MTNYDKTIKFINEFFPNDVNNVKNLLTDILNDISKFIGGKRVGYQGLDTFPDFMRPYPSADFGYFNEDYLGGYFETMRRDLDVKLFPNGPTNFPDININGINFDFKAVKCPIRKNGKYGAPSYHNAIHASYNVVDEFKRYFTNNEYSHVIKSFIIYTYYVEHPNNIHEIIGFDIIPTPCTIKTDKNGFAVKHRHGETIQNANVCLGYNGINATETYEECFERLRNAAFKD